MNNPRLELPTEGPLNWRESLAERLLLECLDARTSLRAITPAQLETAQLLAKGYTSAEVGRRQGIARGTVELHLAQALQRLDLHTRVELCVMVAKAGLS